MSLKEYSISVKTTGYEYYTVEAHTEEEAINLIKNGDVYRDWETDRKSTRLNSSHSAKSRMPSSA